MVDLQSTPSTSVMASPSVKKVSSSKNNLPRVSQTSVIAVVNILTRQNVVLKMPRVIIAKGRGISSRIVKKRQENHLKNPQTPLQANKVDREFMSWILKSQMRNRTFTHFLLSAQAATILGDPGTDRVGKG